MINIRYFASLRENLGSQGEEIEFGEQSESVDALIQLLVARGEPWTSEFTADTKVLVAVNQEMCQGDRALNDGDEVAFFPPVTGG